MSKHFSFVALVVGMLVLFSCSTVNTLEMLNGRMHNVKRTTFCSVPVHTQAEVVKTDAELEQEAKEATAALKMEMRRLVSLARADAQVAKDKAKQFEMRVGMYTKLCGWALIGLGLVAHCFVSAPTLRSIASSVACGGVCIVVLGMLIKWTIGWELYILLGVLAIGIPALYKLRHKGYGLKDDDERLIERRKRMAP